MHPRCCVLLIAPFFFASCDEKQVNEAGKKVGNASSQFTEGLMEKPMDKLKQQQAELQEKVELERIERERRASYEAQKRKAEAEQRANQQRLRK